MKKVKLFVLALLVVSMVVSNSNVTTAQAASWSSSSFYNFISSLFGGSCVITSYSIHYTKLYDR